MYGLDETAKDALGKTLYVRTSYGYGWSNSGTPDPMPLPDFEIELHGLWKFKGQLRGGTARVTQIGHPADGLWLVFSTRHTGHYNFRDKLGEYNLSIGRGEPVFDEAGWPAFHSEPLHSGWGSVSYPGVSPDNSMERKQDK